MKRDTLTATVFEHLKARGIDPVLLYPPRMLHTTPEERRVALVRIYRRGSIY